MRSGKQKKVFATKERFRGVYIPENENITFTREWSGHRFTDKECEDLLKGKVITFRAYTKTKKPYMASGSLKKSQYNGHEYWGFVIENEPLPSEWSGHKFTKEEYVILQNGGTVYIPDAVSKKSGKPYSCVLSFSEVEGKKQLVPQFG